MASAFTLDDEAVDFPTSTLGFPNASDVDKLIAFADAVVGTQESAGLSAAPEEVRVNLALQSAASEAPSKQELVDAHGEQGCSQRGPAGEFSTEAQALQHAHIQSADLIPAHQQLTPHNSTGSLASMCKSSSTVVDWSMPSRPAPGGSGKHTALRDRVDAALGMSHLGALVQTLCANQADIQDAEAKLQILLARQSVLLAGERLLAQQALLDSLSASLGYSVGRPVASLLIHRCAIHWNLLSPEQGSLLGGPAAAPLLEALSEALARLSEEDEMSAAHDAAGTGSRGAALEMAHWLCVISTLLAMIDKQVPRMVAVDHKQTTAEKLNLAAKKVSNTLSSFGKSMLQRMQRSTDATTSAGPMDTRGASSDGNMPHGGTSASTLGAGGSDQVSDALAISPAMAFRYSLEVLLIKCYSACRDNIKRTLSTLLASCVQAPGGMPHEPQAGSSFSLAADDDHSEEGHGGPMERTSPHLLAPWRCLLGALEAHLALLRSAHMPRILIKCLFKQSLCFINSQLFNQLLLRPEVCSTSNTTYLHTGMAMLDAWLTQGGHGAEDLRVLSKDLRHLRQACAFLSHPPKSSLRLEDITTMCPDLNLQQLYRLCTTTWDDSPVTSGGAGAQGAGREDGLSNSIPGEVLEEMKRQHNVQGNGGLLVTCLLEDDSAPIISPGGVPASDMLRLIDDTPLYAPLPIPAALLEAAEGCGADIFAFLQADLRARYAPGHTQPAAEYTDAMA